MKKRLMAMLVVLSMIVAAVGCAKGYKIGENGEVYNDYVKVKKWKELEIERVDPIEVKEEDVVMSIESDLQTLKTYVEIKDRGAKNGDQVTLAYVGKVNGVAFEGGTSLEDAVFILGQGSFIPGFQEGLVGHKMGESFDVPVTFPKDYTLNPDLAGKEAVFTMTLKKVEQVIIPELTDETAKQLNPKAKNVEEYKKLVRENLENNNKEAAEQEMRAGLVSLLIEQSELIENPKEMEDTIKTWTEFMNEQLEYQASMYNMTADALMEAMGYTEDVFKDECKEMAKNSLLTKYAVELILDVEKISHTEEDYEKFLEEEVKNVGAKNTEEVVEALESYFGPNGAELYFLQMRVSDFLWENCKIVEPKKTETESQIETNTESETEKESEETVTE